MPIYDAVTVADDTFEQSQEDGKWQDSHTHSSSNSGRSSPARMFNPYFTPRTNLHGHKSTPLDRQEIIRRIKSKDDHSRPASPEVERQAQQEQQSEDRTELGLQIERPRSALHRGDFREKETSVSGFETFASDAKTLSTSPPAPWHPSFAASTFKQAWQERRRTPEPATAYSSPITNSQFLYKLPTSPLAQSSRPDTPPPGHGRTSRSPDKRRHTFSPQALKRFASDITPLATRTHPYQAHQPRRSIHTLPAGSPPLPVRRPSISSDAHSPLHHAHMVGSYEESILRGRMSTTPSKPLNFIAQIGVLGKGTCKTSLRCPPHVTVPFPAVFYSYGAGSKQPSPYVGLVDLENGLAGSDTPDRRRQRLGERLQAALGDVDSGTGLQSRDLSPGDVQRRRQKQKADRRSGSPRAPPGGSYRIPQQGQLQIVIKNPNKTAVKLFLIPYDLSDMTPGQKTFIRQRSYSAGPIIDMPLSSRRNLGTDRPEASLSTSEDPNDRPMLRYLVHLHICCTGKDRYWLYKSVRLVFANRVPDGKEKLRNEIQLPEPRYSTYKSTRASQVAETAASVQTEERIHWRPMPASLPAATGVPEFRFPFNDSGVPQSHSSDDSMDVDEAVFAFERDEDTQDRRHGESLISRRLKHLDV